MTLVAPSLAAVQVPEQILAGTHGVPKLDPLTSLRFFAAAMIVLHHGRVWGIGPAWPEHFALAQGVSFFFVLSGFVLAYNYPVLPDWAARRSFYLARFARIWPTHIASALLFVALVPTISYFALPAEWREAITLAYVTLTHAWIPFIESVGAYNTVSWTISVEFFFYLLFPWLVADWKRTGKAKLAATFALAIATMVVAHLIAPLAGDPGTTRGMIAYINPLARLFEFTLGIAVCELHRTHGQRLAAMLSARAGTLLEVAVVATIVLGAWLSIVVPENAVVAEALTATGVLVMRTSGLGIFLYAAGIFVFAVGAGFLSQVLRARPLVFLGEISFALYMVHTLFLLYRQRAPWIFADLGDSALYALYWATGLALAVLMHLGVEVPSQALIRGFAARRPMRGWQRRAAALAAFCAMVAVVVLVQPSNRVPLEASSAASPSNLLAQPALFEPAYRLEAVELVRAPDDRPQELRFAWSAADEVGLAKLVAVHLLDGKGAMVRQLDFALETGYRAAARDERWANVIPLTGVDLGDVTALGIAVYDLRDMSTLATDYAGPNDWDRRRLILPLTGMRSGDVVPFALTDANWVAGISRAEAAFFVENSPERQALLAPGKKVTFADGSVRKLVRTEVNGPYLNVVVDGPPLDGLRVGHPLSVRVE